MAKIVLKDQRIFADGYELTSRSNSCMVEAMQAMQECTPFGVDWREYLAGLKDYTFGCGGYMDIDDADAMMFNKLDNTDFVLTVTPETQAVGGIAFLMKAVQSSLQLLGSVGEVAPFQIGAAGNSIMGRGVILWLPATTTDSDANGTAVQISNAASGKTLSCAVHVLSVSGTSPTLDITIESDDASGMSSPTTIVAADQFTAVGAYYSETTLASADDYFRAVIDVGGTSPEFSVIVSISIT